MGANSGLRALLCVAAAAAALNGQGSQTVSFTVNAETKGFKDANPGPGETYDIKVQQITASAVSAVLTYTFRSQTATETITFTPPSGSVTGHTIGAIGNDGYFHLDQLATFQVALQAASNQRTPQVVVGSNNRADNCTLNGPTASCTFQDLVISTPQDRDETSGPNFLAFYISISGGLFDAHVNVYYDFSAPAFNSIGFYNNGLVSPDPSVPIYAAGPDPDELPTFYATVGYQLRTTSVGAITLELLDASGNVLAYSERCFKTDSATRPTGKFDSCIVGPTGGNIAVAYMVLRPADFTNGIPGPTPPALPTALSQLKLVATLTPDSGAPVTANLLYTLAPKPSVLLQMGNGSSSGFVSLSPDAYALVLSDATAYKLNGDAELRISYSAVDPNERASMLLRSQMVNSQTFGSNFLYPLFNGK
jgi:hypothetical protein